MMIQQDPRYQLIFDQQAGS